jgi:hypothetical protein
MGQKAVRNKQEGIVQKSPTKCHYLSLHAGPEQGKKPLKIADFHVVGDSLMKLQGILNASRTALLQIKASL